MTSDEELVARALRSHAQSSGIDVPTQAFKDSRVHRSGTAVITLRTLNHDLPVYRFDGTVVRPVR